MLYFRIELRALRSPGRPHGPADRATRPQHKGRSDTMSATTKSFADLGLSPEVLRALTDLGFEEPTPIQEQTISLLLTGRDVIAQAQTGSGKTAT